jgi:hypothetical protein
VPGLRGVEERPGVAVRAVQGGGAAGGVDASSSDAVPAVRGAEREDGAGVLGVLAGGTVSTPERARAEGCLACAFNHETTPPGMLHTHPAARLWKSPRHRVWLRLQWEEQGGVCVLCSEPVLWPTPGQPRVEARVWAAIAPSRDHLWPLMWGGPFAWWNEACVHGACNEGRGDTVGTVVERLLTERVGARAVKAMYAHTLEHFALDMRWHTGHVLAMKEQEPLNRATHALVEEPGGLRAVCTRCGLDGHALYDRPCAVVC